MGLFDRVSQVVRANLENAKEKEGKIKHSQPSPTKCYLTGEPDKIQSGSETLIVPHGVKVRVKRSRTVEHTIDVEWLRAHSLEVGVKNMIHASILSEIQKARRKAYKDSETIEYEVELDGEQSNQYLLIWLDIWCKGFIEITLDGTTQFSPFRFREGSELCITSVT